MIAYGMKLKKILQYKTPSMPLKKTDNLLVFSIMPNYSKTHIHETFQPHQYIFINQQVNEVNTFLNLPLPPSPQVKYFTPNKVKQTF